jgi:hypothetical protein
MKQFEFIAVDFDGTLCEHRFPEIGEPKWDVIAYIRQQAEQGTKIILNTCRDNVKGGRQFLDEAVKWCLDNEVVIDAVNDNPWVDFGKSGKLYADIYIDDRAVNVSDLQNQIRAGRLSKLICGLEGGK